MLQNNQGANDATYTTHPCDLLIVYNTPAGDPTQPTVYGLTMVGWGWEIPASLQTHVSYLLNHTFAHTHANRCPISFSCSCNEPSPHLAAGHKAQTAIMPLMTPLPAALRRTHTSSIHTQGNGPARIRPLLPAALSLTTTPCPLPSLIGPATATAVGLYKIFVHLCVCVCVCKNQSSLYHPRPLALPTLRLQYY